MQSTYIGVEGVVGVDGARGVAGVAGDTGVGVVGATGVMHSIAGLTGVIAVLVPHSFKAYIVPYMFTDTDFHLSKEDSDAGGLVIIIPT